MSCGLNMMLGNILCCKLKGLNTARRHVQMTNGGSRGRQKSDRKQSAWDKIFLAVLCAPLLPGDLGPVPLLHAACGMGAKAATVLSAALVYTAPIVIPLLVWNALGEQRSLCATEAHVCIICDVMRREACASNQGHIFTSSRSLCRCPPTLLVAS